MKRNVIEMRICVDTINGVIRIKNSACLSNDKILLIRENERSKGMITTASAMNIFACSEKLAVYSGALKTI